MPQISRAPAIIEEFVHRDDAESADRGQSPHFGSAQFERFAVEKHSFALSPARHVQALAKDVARIDRLAVADIGEFLAGEPEESAHLAIAADVFAYIADFAAVCAAVARVLKEDALFGFTVETHDGEGAIVGPKMRYAHSAGHVRRALADANLTLVELSHASSRTEHRVPVPGLVVLARR